MSHLFLQTTATRWPLFAALSVEPGLSLVAQTRDHSGHKMTGSETPAPHGSPRFCGAPNALPKMAADHSFMS